MTNYEKVSVIPLSDQMVAAEHNETGTTDMYWAVSGFCFFNSGF